MGLPPLPLIAIFAIIVFYISLSTYFSYKAKLEQTVISLKIFLLFLPVLLIILARHLTGEGRFKIRLPKPDHDSIHRAGKSPFGVAMLTVLLLVLVSYHPSLKAKWFRPLWYTTY